MACRRVKTRRSDSKLKGLSVTDGLGGRGRGVERAEKGGFGREGRRGWVEHPRHEGLGRISQNK